MKDPQCIVCKKEATYCSPADLCDRHWREWWDFKIEIKNRKVVKQNKK